MSQTRMSRRPLLGLAAGLMAGRAMAQPAWPRQPVRIILPAAGGGSSDPLARFGAQEFTRRFGQPFVVENRPGAAGNVGMAAAARAPATRCCSAGPGRSPPTWRSTAT